MCLNSTLSLGCSPLSILASWEVSVQLPWPVGLRPYLRSYCMISESQALQCVKPGNPKGLSCHQLSYLFFGLWVFLLPSGKITYVHERNLLHLIQNFYMLYSGKVFRLFLLLLPCNYYFCTSVINSWGSYPIVCCFWGLLFIVYLGTLLQQGFSCSIYVWMERDVQ